MKGFITVAAGIFCSTGGFAQFSSLPPSSTVDGISVQSIGLNAGGAHWESSASIGAYAVVGDGYADPLSASSPDGHLGLTWQQGISAGALSAKNQLAGRGGVVRVIFVGETAAWQNDFGYTFSGRPSDSESFTVFHHIQAGSPDPTVRFGDHVDIPLSIGEARDFDLWYNAVGRTDLEEALPATGLGGVYTAFDPRQSDPSSAIDQFLWARDAVSVNTWIPSLGNYANVDTYLLSAEDWRLSAGSDRDYSDLRIALQFFESTGTPLAQIPESSTFALACGILALTGALCRQRRMPRTFSP